MLNMQVEHAGRQTEPMPLKPLPLWLALLFFGIPAVLVTWDILSRRRTFELSLPSSFSLSGETGPSIQVGNRSRSVEKRPV